MISKKIIRKIYAPLNITTGVEIQGNPVQLYRTMTEVYSPNRQTEPLKLVPKIFVGTGAGDSTWVDGLVNKNLSEVKWYANGKDISTIDTFAGKYSINGDSGNARGTLTISANISPAEQYEFVMSAVFTDPRTNENVTVRTDAVSVYTTEETIDEWDLSVVRDVNIKYHPLYDKLKEYEYKVQKGIITESVSAKKACYDGNQYDLSLPIIITKGKSPVDEGDEDWANCNIKLYAVKGNNKGEVTTADCLFVKEVSKKNIRLDLRLIPDGTVLQVELEVTLDGQTFVMGMEQLTVTRIVDNYTCEPSNEGDIDLSQKKRYDKAVCYVSGRKMEYPEAYLQIMWYTNTSKAQAVQHGTGETVAIDIEAAQIGTGADCWLETYLESKVRSYVAAITVDEAGNVALTNEQGEVITVEVLEG